MGVRLILRATTPKVDDINWRLCETQTEKQNIGYASVKAFQCEKSDQLCFCHSTVFERAWEAGFKTI